MMPKKFFRKRTVSVHPEPILPKQENHNLLSRVFLFVPKVLKVKNIVKMRSILPRTNLISRTFFPFYFSPQLYGTIIASN